MDVKTRNDWYEAKKAAGLCTSCGRNPAVKGRVRCAECMAKRRKTAKPESHKKPKMVQRYKYIPKAPPKDAAEGWIVSAETCKGCQYYLPFDGGGSRWCSYTYMTGMIKQNPCVSCEVKTIGRLPRRQPQMPQHGVIITHDTFR